jgi:hypothetical protein
MANERTTSPTPSEATITLNDNRPESILLEMFADFSFESTTQPLQITEIPPHSLLPAPRTISQALPMQNHHRQLNPRTQPAQSSMNHQPVDSQDCRIPSPPPNSIAESERSTSSTVSNDSSETKDCHAIALSLLSSIPNSSEFVSPMWRLRHPSDETIIFQYETLEGENRFPRHTAALDIGGPFSFSEQEVWPGEFDARDFDMKIWFSTPIFLMPEHHTTFRSEHQFRGIRWRAQSRVPLPNLHRGSKILLHGLDGLEVNYFVCWARSITNERSILQINAITRDGRPVKPFNNIWPAFILEVPHRCDVPLAPQLRGPCAHRPDPRIEQGKILRRLNIFTFAFWKLGCLDPFRDVDKFPDAEYVEV